ncbi:MAG: helix-turn-helix transcriptional regulator [Verrucomicrobiota bacterium]
MKWQLLTDETVLDEIGQRLARQRINRRLTQRQLAQESGVSLRTLQRLENGETSTNLSSFIRVCRTLGLLDSFEVMLPKNLISPIQQLKLQQAQPQRVRPKAKKKSTE